MGRNLMFFCVGALSVLSAFLFSWRRGTNVTENLLSQYDYIIVGAGSAGCVLAARLSEDPHIRVLLLEAGGDDMGNLVVSTPVAYFDAWLSDLDWSFYSSPQANSLQGYKGKQNYWPRGKVLGGSSSINAMIYTRGSRHDYDGWRDSGAEGWGYEDVLPYFLKSEDIQVNRYKTSDYHHQGGELHVSENNVTSVTDAFIQAGKELGYQEVDVNGREMIGFTRISSTTINGVRDSSARAFLRPAAERPNLHISINSRATKIVMEGQRAVGVEMIKANRKYTIRAEKEVILSAGAVMSPQLLMLSGIGPRDHLQDMGIPVVADLPVGDNLQDHMMLAMFSKTNSTDLFSIISLMNPLNWLRYLTYGSGWIGNTGILTSIGFLQLDEALSKTRAGQPDMELYVVPNNYGSSPREKLELFNQNEEIVDQFIRNAEKENSIFFLVSPMHPKSRGTIRLGSADPFDNPVIDPRYLQHPDDVDMFIKGVRFTEKLAKTPACQRLGLDIDDVNYKVPKCVEQFGPDSDRYWECAVRTMASTVFHPVGTCKMGPIGDTSTVVDPQLRVKGLQGLRVVDASVMPRIITGHPNAPTIMIAEKIADDVRGVDSVRHLRAVARQL